MTPTEYQALVKRVKVVVERVVPHGSTVLVATKGDEALLDLQGRTAWHFPQRRDGLYPGHHPAGGPEAVAHLQGLCGHGARYLVLPATMSWWLEHYRELAEYLETSASVLHRDPTTCLIYALSEVEVAPSADAIDDTLARLGPVDAPVLRHCVEAGLIEDIQALFDAEYYERQHEGTFDSRDDALLHYLTRGYREAHDPHPLFATTWYRERYLQHARDVNPLVDFVERSVRGGQDPNPYFDTEYYYSQGTIRESGQNALIHYLRFAGEDGAFHPNPLFRDGFYLQRYLGKPSSVTPLAHFLTLGWEEGKLVSPVHESMSQALEWSQTGGLTRGRWTVGSVLLIPQLDAGASAAAEARHVALCESLFNDFHLECIVVRDMPAPLASDAPVKSLVLEDYRLACDLGRPSAMRLLIKALAALRPMFAISERAEYVQPLALARVPTYFAPHDVGDEGDADLAPAVANAQRVVVDSAETVAALAAQLGHRPWNLSRRTFVTAGRDDGTATRHVGPAQHEDSLGLSGLLKLASRDFGLDPRIHTPVRNLPTGPIRKVIVPCSDWGVSGVNTSLQSLATELIKRGWEMEIVFTRSAESVVESAGSADLLPTVPYRFLARRKGGIEGMWEALIAYVESCAPCIVLTTYDFVANGVVAALTERIGVVNWVQADDGDYYEQVYRLGRYCNAIVCVSDTLKERVTGLNPLFGGIAHVVPNASLDASEVARSRRFGNDRLRLVYAGRLVQYQKRILDVIELATSLDALDLPYEISLIGSFSPREPTEAVFRERAREHLGDGRIQMVGRVGKEEVLNAFTENDFFILLSDFEGLPLSLVEAMGRGCVPVAAEMDSGIPDVVVNGENGLIVSGRDYDKWAREIVDVWGDRQRLRRISTAARRTVRGRFTAQRAAARFDRILVRVAQEIASQTYHRPPSLNWGPRRSTTGDVVAPPTLYRPGSITWPGLS